MFFKDVKGRFKMLDGVPYAISSSGVVINVRTGRIRKPQYNSQNGYEMLLLIKDGKYRNYYVHRLVAELFVPNPNNYEIVVHLDGDRKNNNSSNLAYISRSEWIKRFRSGKSI